MRQVLVRHPEFPCDAVREIAADIVRDGSLVRLTYVATGAMAGLQVPAPAAPERTDELWKHTCFELFVKPAGGDAYDEFNFAPSTAWAAYAFDAHRTGMRELEIAAPRISVARNGQRLTMDVALDICGVPADGPWTVAMSAVIEEMSGRRSYWALKHPAGRPDFHAAAGFAVNL
jgi:hypothetical protein